MDLVMGHEQPLQAHQPHQAHQTHQSHQSHQSHQPHQSLAMNLSDHGMDLCLGGSGLTNSGVESSSLGLLGSSLDSLGSQSLSSHGSHLSSHADQTRLCSQQQPGLGGHQDQTLGGQQLDLGLGGLDQGPGLSSNTDPNIAQSMREAMGLDMSPHDLTQAHIPATPQPLALTTNQQLQQVGTEAGLLFEKT